MRDGNVDLVWFEGGAAVRSSEPSPEPGRLDEGQVGVWADPSEL